MRLPNMLNRPVVAGLTLATLLLAGNVHAQATKPAAAPSGPPRPLSDYVPREYQAFHFEVVGTDANPEAWKKTATYKILNETPTGAMLEAMMVQAIDHYSGPEAKLKGAEIVRMLKHVAAKGGVIASSAASGNEKSHAVIVVRGITTDKTVQALFRRLIMMMNGTDATEKLSVVEGHKIVEATVPQGTTRRSSNFWWIEETKKQDLVLSNSAVSAAKILKALDGASPTAAESPLYQAVSKSDSGLVPFLKGVIDFRGLPANVPKVLAQLQMGFDNDAIMTVVKIPTAKPRSGALALLEQAPIDKSSYPALPEGVNSFTMMSSDLASSYDELFGLLKSSNPELGGRFETFANAMKTKARIRLKEDVLANLGPRAYLFEMPKASSGGLSALIPGVGAGLPRIGLVFEVKDPVPVGKALDELMLLANKELKTLAPPPAPAGAGNAPGGPGVQGPGGEGEGGRAGRATAPTTFEFKSVGSTGSGKQFILSIPPDLAKQLGGQLRPTVRLSGKQLVLGITPDVARLAVEAKKPWTPSSGSTDLVGSFPSKVLMLSIGDQTEATASTFASLPGRIQAGVNLVTGLMAGRGGQAGGAPGAAGPGGAVAGGPPSAIVSGGGPGAIAPGGPPAAAPGGGRRDDIGGPISGGGGAPGAEGAAPAGALTFQIPAESMPRAEDIKSKLFPSSFALAVDDEAVTILWRSAFVDVGDASSSAMMTALLLPAIQSARKAAGMAPLPVPDAAGGQPAPGGAPTPGGFRGQPGAPGGPAGPGGGRGGRRGTID